MIAVAACVVSGEILRLTSVPVLALSRLSVTPGMAPVTVLVALEIANPLTVSEAFEPATACVKPSPVELPEEETVKLAALPDVLATIASRDPVASVTTLAVTPKSSPLIWLATSFRLSVPSVVMVVVVPLAAVMVKLPAGNAAVGSATVFEAHDAVVARLLTTTTLSPEALPEAAVAETMLALEEVTVAADKGPVKLFSD